MSQKLRVLDTFAGIGGFSLGLERTGGFETVAFCEIEPYPQKVLAKHWPGVPIYEDVRQLTAERLATDGIGVDVITGGFPCQDISTAGNQAGIAEGTRSGLWSEVARLIGELRPRYAIMENVTALLSGDSGRWFGRVLGDLAEIGYDAEWECIPASAILANHHRDRVWIVAYPKSLQRNGGSIYGINLERQENRLKPGGGDSEGNAANANSKGLQGSQEPRVFGEGRKGWIEFTSRPFCNFGQVSQIKPTICGGSNGVPAIAHRLKSLGNAVVPQIPELIGRAILESEVRA